MTDYFDNRDAVTVGNEDISLPLEVERALLDVNPASFILDIGCGYGRHLRALKRNGFVNCHGVDVSSKAIESCRHSGLSAELIGDLGTWLKKDAKPIYQFVVMTHVLEHLPKEQVIPILKLIREKALTSSGRIYLAVPNAQSNTGAYWAYEDFTHHTIFTSGSLLYVLRAAGFTEIEFVDVSGTSANRWFIAALKQSLQFLYRVNRRFWNRVTSSSYHVGSPEIFTYDLKVLAK